MDIKLISDIMEGKYSSDTSKIGTTFQQLLDASDTTLMMPDSVKNLDRVQKDFMYSLLRHPYVEKWSWAYRPDLVGFQRLQQFIGDDFVLEINAGKALWAELYRRLVATDPNRGRWHCTDIQEQPDSFYPVEVLSDVDAIERYTEANVLVSIWPRSGVPDQLFKGNKLIYVGEKAAGCTGTPSFFEVNSEGKEVINQDEWKLVDVIKNNKWYAIHDKCYLFKRNHKIALIKWNYL
jgi:hypothetical protein